MNDYELKCPAEGGCLSPGTHKRLAEAHKMWHECLESYQDPDEFTMYLNLAIQTLRNVTFTLQKELAHTEGFVEWYDSWRDAMKASPVMKWSIDARNIVVKQGDLETLSKTVASISVTYLDIAARVAEDYARRLGPGDIALDPEPLTSLSSILNTARLSDMPETLRKDAVLHIERRWVDINVPEWELLDALSYIFSFLAALVSDLHPALMGCGEKLVSDPAELEDEGQVYRFRPPCMQTTQELRSIMIRVATGEIEGPGYIQGALSALEDFDTQPVDGYPVPKVPFDAESALDYVPAFFPLAKKIVETHSQHGWFVHYFRGAERLDFDLLMARTRAEKWQLAMKVANKAVSLGADGVLEMGEVWMASADEGVEPAQAKSRKEGLVLSAEISTGEIRSITVPFKRTFYGSVVFEPPEYSKATSNFFAPLRKVWEKQRADGKK